MGIHLKVSSSGSSTDWRSIKKIWAKNNSGWQAITALYSKVTSGWTKMWPGNAPSVRLSDPINIRLGGYNGTIATSPQLFASTDQGTTGTFLKLWGNDGSFDGVTPITISNRRMLCSDNIDGQVERFSLSGNDTIDFATTSQATRDLAEGYYIFYQMLASNVDGDLDAYSPPIKVIKRRPALVSYTVLSETGGALQGQSGFSSFDVIELNAQIRWGWWIKPGGYLGGTPLLRWWKNTSKSPGGTLLKSINIETGYDSVSGSTDTNFLSDTNTSNVLTIYNNYGVSTTPLQAGQYIVAELYLENSYTAHYSAPVSYWGSTGATPTLTSVSLRTYDGQVDTVMDNQSDPRIVSQAYFEIVAQVADYESGTTFNFEPRIYKADTGVYLNYDSGATISGGFPTDVSPYSVSQSGTTATVIWRTYINSNFLTGSPTYGGGQAKYWFDFRLSATKSGGGTSYYTGIVSSNHGNTSLSATYMFGSSGGSIYIHPHTQSVLSANNYTVGSAPQTIRFSVTGDSYPSGYASYPRSYGIDFGDGSVENIAWPTGTSNPSYTTWDHTYTTNGTFTARLITVPQGFTNIGTRQRVITVQLTSYTVTWNGNGGSTGNEGTPWSFTAGGTVTVPSVSRMGHTFERWADTSSGSYTYTTTGGTFSPPAQNITMYARWQINVCTIPNVIGMTEYNASNALNNAGFAYEYTYYVNTSNASLDGTVQSVDPGVGTQPGCGSNVALTLYQYVAAPVKLSAPTGVNATDDRTDGSYITWNAVSGASYYGIWWGGQPGYDNAPDFPNISATSYLDTAITAGNTRAYYVQAYASGNPAGTKSDWSSYEVGSRVDPEPTITYGACTAYGAPYASTSGYDCYGNYSYAYTDNYYYQRRQILSNGTWNGSYDYSCGNTSVRTYGSYSQVNGQCGYTPPVEAPTTPTGVSLSGSGAVSWNASSGSTSYDIQVYTATSSSGANRQGPFVTTNISGTSYQLGSQEGYTGSNNYARVQVRGRNSAGAVSTYGGWVPSSTTYT